MVGKIYKIITPYYDRQVGGMRFKSRPGLIVSNPNGYDLDYIVLPVSRIKQKQYIDPKYDVKIEKNKYPLLNLNEDSYIRAGKQTNVNRSSIGDMISDMKSNYEDKYLDVLDIMQEFNKDLVDKAI